MSNQTKSPDGNFCFITVSSSNNRSSQQIFMTETKAKFTPEKFLIITSCRNFRVEDDSVKTKSSKQPWLWSNDTILRFYLKLDSFFFSEILWEMQKKFLIRKGKEEPEKSSSESFHLKAGESPREDEITIFFFCSTAKRNRECCNLFCWPSHRRIIVLLWKWIWINLTKNYLQGKVQA